MRGTDMTRYELNILSLFPKTGCCTVLQPLQEHICAISEKHKKYHSRFCMIVPLIFYYKSISQYGSKLLFEVTRAQGKERFQGLE
jgi:hypothetical protein